MDWKVLFSTFSIVFLAELGDKTQLAGISLTAQTKKPLEVFIGALSALTLVTLIGVIVGEGLLRVVPEIYIRRVASLIFVVMGLLIWFRVI